MRKLASVAPVLSGMLTVLLLSSCLEEEGEMILLPDGAGRIDLEVVFGAQLSDSIRDEVSKGRAMVDECRKRIGSTWKGFAYWSHESAEEQGGDGQKRVHYRGSAWFRNASEVSLNGQRWKWTPWDDANQSPGDAPRSARFEFAFDPLPTPGDEETRAEQFEKWSDLLAGFDATLRIRLPGPAKVRSGPGKADGRHVTFRLNAADLEAGARLAEDERTRRYHRVVIEVGPASPEAAVEQDAFQRAWKALDETGVPHESVAPPPQPTGPVPAPLPLDPPITLAEADRFYGVPATPPDWKLEKSAQDDLSEWWSGSIRGSRHERIPVIIRVPRKGRPCPVAIKQHTWHGTKESGQETGLPVLQQGVAVVSFDGPLVGSRKIEGRDPLGESPESAADNHRWAVSDLRAVIRALPAAPLPSGLLTTDDGMVVVGVSLGGPTAITAFALEPNAAAGATVVAGAGVWSAARDREPPGTSLEGAGDMRLRTTAADQRVAALLDPATILPLTPPRPVAMVGGMNDPFAPPASLRRLARSIATWPEVHLRIHPEVGHFITEEQAREVTDWIVRQARRLR